MAVLTRRRVSGLPALVVAALALVSFSAPAVAQVRLDQPTGTLTQDFGSIQTVRELPDGRVLVADPLGKALYAVDFDAGTRTQVGAEGQGPQEYRQPDAVWPLPGDSTLLVDLGNGRLVALGPSLKFGPTRPIAQGDFQPGQPLVLAIPQAVDGSGATYFRSMGGGLGGGELPDSGDILRLPRHGGAAETVARFKLQKRILHRSGGANRQNVSMEVIPLSPEDAWGVAADGSVVIARSGDYHVEWIARDGSVTRGQPVVYDALPIDDAEKKEYLAEQARSGGGIGVQVQVVDGRPSMSFQRGGPAPKREIDQYTWPDRMPAFYGGRIPVDREGRAWVRRHVKAGQPSTYDVFDGRGARVGTVLLAPGDKVVGFGDGAAYVVRFDDMDLSYLERYALPAL
jgi:hypothetical protein